MAPGPQNASWLPGSLRQSPINMEHGDVAARVQGRGCPSSSLGPLGGLHAPTGLGWVGTQVTWSPWRTPRVLKRRSPKPRACLPPGPHTQDAAGPQLPLGVWGRTGEGGCSGERGFLALWALQPACLPLLAWVLFESWHRTEVWEELWGRSPEDAPDSSAVVLGEPPNLSERHTPYL